MDLDAHYNSIEEEYNNNQTTMGDIGQEIHDRGEKIKKLEQQNAKLREFLQRISKENICDYDRCKSWEQIKNNYTIMKHILFLVRAELKELEDSE